MIGYLIKLCLAALVYVAAHFAVCMFVASPIAAEYWVRELIIVKQKLVSSMPPNRLIVVGGSNVLFGVDAQQIQAATQKPTFNFGLHAGMRFDQLLEAPKAELRDGDVLLLALEDPFYKCDGLDWNDWQLRNAIAWGRRFYGEVPLSTKMDAVLFAGGPGLSWEMIADKFGETLYPSAYAGRIRSLGPASEIWSRYVSGKFKPATTVYSAYNIDDHGDIEGAVGSTYDKAGVDLRDPAGICPKTVEKLKRLVDELKQKGVRVIVTHTPYIVDDKPPGGWQDAERQFRRDLGIVGAEVLEDRDALFLPRSDFFDTDYHLNETGRKKRTDRMIVDLERLNVVAARDQRSP